MLTSKRIRRASASGRRTRANEPPGEYRFPHSWKSALQDWLSQHPGGQMMFCWKKDPEDQPTALKPMLAYDQFRRLVRGSKWDVMKGWHVLRHSFISICAAESVDQRVLQSWVGHLSAATHKCYTHLIPSREQQILNKSRHLAMPAAILMSD